MAVNPLEAFAQGQGLVNSFATQLGRRQAAQGLASGNYAQALSALGGMGDIGGVIQVQNAQAQQQTRQRERQEADLAQQVAFSRQATRALEGALTQGGDPVATFDSMAPAFQALGATPEQFQTYRQALAANPQGFLQQIKSLTDNAARRLEVVNLGGGTAVTVDLDTGNEVNRYEGRKEPIKLGDVLFDPETYEPIVDARGPEYKPVQNTDGSTTWIAIDQPAPIRGTGGGSSDTNEILRGILQREGGFVARDGRSGAPANFGINQRANPDIDVANLTRPQAEQIYRERYINPIVQAGVSGPALEAVIDFGVNAGVQRSLDFWRRSGGDIGRFNELRLQHYRSLPDYQQNGRSWERRVAETTPASVDTRGGSRVVAQGENRGSQVSFLSPEEKQSLGLPANGVYQRDREGKVTQVAGSGSRDTNLNQTDQRRISASISSAESASALANDARRFVELNRRAGTNPIVGAAGPVASLNPTYAEMRAIQSRMAPLMREAGSGAMSDRDVSLFLRSIPSIGNPTETNVALASVIQAGAQRAQDRVAFLEDYAQKNGNLLGAQEQWNRYTRANPLFEERGGNTKVRNNVPDWRDFFSGSTQTQSGSQPRTNAPGLRFNITESQLQTRQRLIQQGASPSAPLGSTRNPRYLNPADPSTSYGNIRRGEYFVHPDGTVRRKP